MFQTYVLHGTINLYTTSVSNTLYGTNTPRELCHREITYFAAQWRL